MRAKSLLKGVVNQDKGHIYINDFWTTEANEKRKRERDIYTENAARPTHQQEEMGYIGPSLYINSLPVPQAKPIHIPKAVEILDLAAETLNEVLKIRLQRGETITERNSRFISYAAQANDLEKIQETYLKVKLLHPTAHHIMCAYKLPKHVHPTFASDFFDDGEHGGGRVLLQLLGDRSNTVLFVVRYYGGQKLGADRFRCIEESAYMVLQQLSESLNIPASPPRTPPLQQIKNSAYDVNFPKIPTIQSTQTQFRGSARGAAGNWPSKSSQRGAASHSNRKRQNFKPSYQAGAGKRGHRYRGSGRGIPRGQRGYGKGRTRTPPTPQNRPHNRQRQLSPSSVYSSQESLTYREDWSHENPGAFDE